MTAYLRPAGGLALVGLLGWTTAEALNEALVYKHCQRSGPDEQVVGCVCCSIPIYHLYRCH